MAQFQIFKQNTDAIATNRGFYYQYLKTVKLWLDNYVDGIDNEIYCEREDDIFEYNVASEASIFRQIKCYSDTVGLNSPEIKGSLLHFYDIYQKRTYKKSEFYIESNQAFKSRVGKSLKAWYERQKLGDFSVLDSELSEIRDVLKSYVQDNLDKFLKKMTEEEKAEAQKEVDDFKSKLELDSFKTFVESLRWDFSEESNPNRAIANLSEDILKIIANDIQYDNRVDSELLLGYLVNAVLEKSIEPDETKRVLTTALLQEALNKTKIDDTLFHSEIKELLKSNFFIPHSLTEPFRREELFIGREDDFVNMREFLNTKNSLLLVHSIGGMGKTTLVKEFLYREKNSYAHYGYLYAGEDIKQNWVNSGFERSLLLFEKNIDKAFTKSFIELQKLEGKILLVVDNIEKAENQKEAIDKIIGLTQQNPNIDIVMTSREIIEEVHEPYELKSLSKKDAKLLFNSIYEVDDEALLEEVLEYLDWHTFFIEKVAQTLKNKKGLLRLEDIKEKFDRQEFPDIRLKKRNSFNDLLQKLFSLDELEDDEVLLLKQLSVLPSIDIAFDFLAQIFQVDDVIEFQEDLDYLNEKGWLIYAEGSYKLHQVIKEFVLLPENAPCFEEITKIINYFIYFMKYISEEQSSIENRRYLIYFRAIYNVIKTMNIFNDKLDVFIGSLGGIFNNLGDYTKSITLHSKSLNMRKRILGENNIATAIAYNNLGSAYGKTNDFTNATKYMEKAFEISKKLKLENNPIIVEMINNLIALYLSIGDRKSIEKASFFLNDNIVEKNKQVFGENDSKLISVYTNIGKYSLSTNEYEKSLNFLKKSLNLSLKIYDETHISTARCYENLMDFFLRMLIVNQEENSSNIKNINFCIKKSKKIREKILPKNHPDLLLLKEMEKMLSQKLPYN